MNASLFEKLDFNKILNFISSYATTECGKKTLLQLKPESNITLAKLEGELVNEAKRILEKDIPPPIDYLPDLHESLSQSRIDGVSLDSKKILSVLKLIIISRNLLQYIKNNKDFAAQLFSVSNHLYVDKMLEHHINKIIDDNGEIKENASPKLSDIRKEIRAKNSQLIKTVNRIVKSLSENDIVREDYITLRDGRVVIPVKAEHKRHLRGFIHSESATGQTVYIEPEETLELNNEILSLSFAERREIERLLKELTKRIGLVSDELKNSLDTISRIDSIFARGKYSIEIIGAFPGLDDNKPFKLINARHPVLLKKLGRESAIPLDIEINKDKIIVITGPNAGGKTVVLKTVGLLVLMVQAGIHVPVQPDSNFHFFNNLFLDIGDEQSLEDDLSTFSSHLSNIKWILKEGNNKSLILLDEIGMGTDPAEGSALATAVLIKLKDKGATVLATTHDGNIKIIANDLEGFQNAAMEFDHINLKPTYKFKQGIPGSSYAFEIARRIGFDNSLLDVATEYLDTNKNKIEDFLIEIEKKSQLLEEKLKQFEQENSRLKELTSQYQLKVKELEKEKREILKKAKLDADNYLININKSFEQIVKELKETKADVSVIKESRKIIQNLKETNKNILPDDIDLTDKSYNFAVGDYASVKNTSTTGKIVDINSEKKKVSLLVGSMKMQVKLSDLIPAKKRKEIVESVGIYSGIDSLSGTRLDIRGNFPEEAEFEVVKFIDTAFTSGLERIEILHGKGTGALKKMVRDVLTNHSSVKNFYYAPIEAGGEGITIAELK